MKTLTEFPGIYLKNALKAKQDLLAGGKTPEELPAALGEALKVEGDRLNYLLAAIELVGNKSEDLKRVVVYTLNEGEKAPGNVVLKDEKYYLVDYYPSLNKNKPGKVFDDKKKGRGKRKGKGGRGGDRDRNRGFRRNEGQERAEGSEAQTAGPGGEGGSDRPRRPRRPRRPHAPPQVQDPNAPRRPPLKPVTAAQPKPAETETKPEEPKSNP